MMGGAIARGILQRMGRDVVAFNHVNHPIARRMHLLKQHAVTLILDVGANVGQFGQGLRSLGYEGRIVSFEPLRSAYAELQKAAQGDPLWTTFNYAIGSSDRTDHINVAGNAQSSSLLDMLPRHLASAPESSYQGREIITVRTLDFVLPGLHAGNDVIFLKSDTQGYEMEVLKGAADTLSRLAGMQMELSLVPLYQGETLFADMINHLSAKGFQLMSIEPAYADPATGQLLQVDGIFYRAPMISSFA